MGYYSLVAYKPIQHAFRKFFLPFLRIAYSMNLFVKLNEGECLKQLRITINMLNLYDTSVHIALHDLVNTI